MGISRIQDNRSHVYHYPTLNPTIFSKFEEGEKKKANKNEQTKNLKVPTNFKMSSNTQRANKFLIKILLKKDQSHTFVSL
jgi:hypothetical protein